MDMYLIAGLAVFALSGVMAMAGLGVAFLVVPMFLAMGIPLAQAAPTALLLNVVSLSVASVNYGRGHLIDWRLAIPVLLAAVVLAPVGAMLTAQVDEKLLRWLFAAFLVFAGWRMLTGGRGATARRLGRTGEAAAGVSVGASAGFLGGLLGVGGGNFVLPVFNWLGLDPKVAVGTTALVVVFSSLSGFLGHASLGRLDPGLVAVGAVAAASGSLVASWLVRERVSSAFLRRIVGWLLLAIAAQMAWSLLS